jgi:hypothetical protein
MIFMKIYKPRNRKYWFTSPMLVWNAAYTSLAGIPFMVVND